MAKRTILHVIIKGTGIDDEFDAMSHEIIGLRANTYHKFVLLNGIEFFLNDFGVRSVAIQKRIEG